MAASCAIMACIYTRRPNGGVLAFLAAVRAIYPEPFAVEEVPLALSHGWKQK